MHDNLQSFSVIPKCLLVDDLPENLTALKGLLKELKVDVHIAHSGTEALELLLQNEYALSLIDVQMPEMDGFELAEIMRSTEKTKYIPIIFVTAGDHDVKRVFKGYGTGAVDFLHKPLYPQVVLGKVRVFIDLYNQKKLLEETYRKANEELEIKVQERTHELMMANNEIESFSYSVSHDLRAPLRSMDGFSKALLTMYEDKLDDRGKDYLTRIRDSAKKMDELIDCMLMLSCLGRQELNRQTVNLSEIAMDIVKGLRNSEPQRNILVDIDECLMAEGDPALLFSLMENLLQNSWKYTSRTASPHIKVGVQVLDSTRYFYVKDNGAGFNMKYADKLFCAFQRLHSPTEFKGSGIGLATVQRIVARHGGKIWANAEVNKGATFYFSLT